MTTQSDTTAGPARRRTFLLTVAVLLAVGAATAIALLLPASGGHARNAVLAPRTPVARMIKPMTSRLPVECRPLRAAIRC